MASLEGNTEKFLRDVAKLKSEYSEFQTSLPKEIFWLRHAFLQHFGDWQEHKGILDKSIVRLVDVLESPVEKNTRSMHGVVKDVGNGVSNLQVILERIKSDLIKSRA